jgi:hypothetical protein
MEDIIKKGEELSSAKATEGKRKLILTIAILVIVAIIAILGLRFFSGEDSWICEGGKWVKHGNPDAPIPTTVCAKDAVSTGKPIGVLDNPDRSEPLNEKLGYGCGGPGSFVSTTIKEPDKIWNINKDGSETKVSLGKYRMSLPERVTIDLPKMWFYFLSDSLSNRDDRWYGLQSSYVSGMILSVNGYEQEIKLGGNEYMFMELLDYPLGDWYPYLTERYVEFEIFIKLKCANIKDGKCLDNQNKPLDYANNADIKSNIRLFPFGCEAFTLDLSTDAKIEYK